MRRWIAYFRRRRSNTWTTCFSTYIDAGMTLSVDVRGTPQEVVVRRQNWHWCELFQEALTNATKHAPGSTVALRNRAGRPISVRLKRRSTNVRTRQGLPGPTKERATV